MSSIKVIGAGLAGCEAAWQIACRGIKTELYEMKPVKKTPAHHSDGFAELVCSNSLKAARFASAAGMLKQEMRILGSLLLECADNSQRARCRRNHEVGDVETHTEDAAEPYHGTLCET